MGDVLGSEHRNHLLVSGSPPYTRSPRQRTRPTPGTRIRSIALLAAAAAGLRLTRYEIANDSMEPTLHAGDWVLGVKRPTRVAVGDVVVIEQPDRPNFRLVKRVAGTDPTGIVLIGDHAGHSVDSRDFGPVPATAVLARLVLVYHPRPLRPL